MDLYAQDSPRKNFMEIVEEQKTTPDTVKSIQEIMEEEEMLKEHLMVEAYYAQMKAQEEALLQEAQRLSISNQPKRGAKKGGRGGGQRQNPKK